MARPLKEGLEYFPLDVYFTEDDKIKLIEARFPEKGFEIIVKLLMKIYREGYFYEWTEERQLLFTKTIVFASNNSVIECNKYVSEVVFACNNYGFFNKNIFDNYNVLTSKGIQRRFFAACARRRRIVVYKELLLIELNQDFNFIFDSINSVIACKNPINDSNMYTKTQLMHVKSTQSKVKESKVNIKLHSEKSKNDFSDSPFFSDAKKLADQFEDNMKTNMPEIFKRLSKNYKTRWIEAFETMLRIDKRPFWEVKKINNHVFDQENSWWAETQNVRTPAKYRKRDKQGTLFYDIFCAEMNAIETKNNNSPPTKKKKYEVIFATS